MSESLEIFLRSRFDATGVTTALGAMEAFGMDMEKIEKMSSAALTPFSKSVEDSRAQITGLLVEMDKLVDVFMEMSAGQFENGFLKQSKATMAYARNLEGVLETQREFNDINAEDLYGDQVQGIHNVNSQLSDLILLKEQEAQAYHKQAASAAIVEQGIGKMTAAFQKDAEAAQNTANKLKGLTRNVDDAHKGFLNFEWLLKNKLLVTLNRVGFAFFITKSSIMQFVGILKSAWSTMSEGANAIDRLEAFSVQMQRAGHSATDLKAEFEEAGKGMVDMNTAMKGSLDFLKAGLPDLAAIAPQLLAISTASVKLTGETDQLSVIYDKLIRGIIKGKTQLIDDTGIVIDVSDANREYAESIGKTVDQLTAQDKIQAAANATLKDGQIILDMAEGMHSYAEAIGQAENVLKETGIALKQTLALAVAWEGQGVKAFRATKVEADGTFDSVEHISNAFSRLDTAVKFIGSGFVGLFILVKRVVGEVIGQFELIVQPVNALKALIHLARTFFFLAQKDLVKANEAWEAYNDTMERAGRVQARAAMDMSGLWREVEEGVRGAQAAMGLFDLDAIRDLPPEFDRATEAVEDLTEALEDAEKAYTDLLRRRGDDQTDFDRDVENIKQKHLDKIADLEVKDHQRREDARRNYLDKIKELEENHSEKMDDIFTDLNDKFEDIEASSALDKIDAQRDKNKKLEKVEEDHQKAIQKIQRKFDLARLRAVIDRDARALFEAQHKRDQDLAAAGDKAEDDRKNAVEAFDEQNRLIDERREQARAKAEKDYERARRDELLSWERRKKDAKQNYDEKIKELVRQFDRERKAANTNYQRDRRDLEKRFREQQQDTKKWYREELEDMNDKYDGEYDLRALRLGEAAQQHVDHLAYLRELYAGQPALVPGGGTAPPTSGIPDDLLPPSTDPPPTPIIPPDPHQAGCPNRANVGAGGACTYNYANSGGCEGWDRKLYVCIQGKWQLAAVQPEQRTESTGLLGNATVGGGGSFRGAGPSGGQQVVITVRGDRTLEQIFREISYDAFIDVVNA